MVDIYAYSLPLLTYMLAYKHLERNLCFYYTILWILFAFLILVLLNLCMSSFPHIYRYIKDKEMKQFA